MHGFHHLRARARRAENGRLEPFPAITPLKRYLDYLMYVVGVVQPLALLPQISAIYIDHAKQGVALTTWMLLIGFNLLWVLYGTVHKDRLIVLANSFAALFDVIIVVGVLYY